MPYGAGVTETLIAAFSESDVVDAVMSVPFRRLLADDGIHTVQVNVDDADVAPALRFDVGTPIATVVTVHGEQLDTVGLLGTFRGIAPDVRVWLVRQHRPIEPPETADGVRADTLANIAFLRRPADLDAAAWEQDWLTRHTPIAIATQGTFGYLQNVVLACLTEAGHDVHGIVEELFPMAALSDPHAFYGSGGDDAELSRRITELMESVHRIGADQNLDLVPTSRFTWRVG